MVGAVNQRVFHTMVEICQFNKIIKENKNLTIIKVSGLGGGEEKIQGLCLSLFQKECS